MFGIKKKGKGKDQTKKKWQLEMEEEEEERNQQNLEKEKNKELFDEIQKEDSDDSAEIQRQREEIEKEEKEKMAKAQEEENKKKQKKYEWMDSEDEDLSVSSETDPIEKERRDQEEARLAREAEENKIPDVLEDKDTRSVFVNNLNFELSDVEIETHFKKFGRILALEVPRNEGTLYNKGRAFVEYVYARQAQRAVMEGNGRLLKNRPLEISIGITQATMTIANNKYSQKQQYYDSRYSKYQRSRSRSRSRDRKKKYRR